MKHWNWREYRENYNRKIRAFIQSCRSQPCHDCGGTFPWWVMQFDRVPERGEKKFTIGTCARRTIPQIIEEVNKCDVVCANCHANRSYVRAVEAGTRYYNEITYDK